MNADVCSNSSGMLPKTISWGKTAGRPKKTSYGIHLVALLIVVFKAKTREDKIERYFDC